MVGLAVIEHFCQEAVVCWIHVVVARRKRQHDHGNQMFAIVTRSDVARQIGLESMVTR